MYMPYMWPTLVLVYPSITRCSPEDTLRTVTVAQIIPSTTQTKKHNVIDPKINQWPVGEGYKWPQFP